MQPLSEPNDMKERTLRQPDSSEQRKAVRDFLWKAHDGVMNDIRFADTKAVMAIGFCSAMISGMFAAGLPRFLRAGLSLKPIGVYETLMAFGTGLALLMLGGACVAATWAFVPRLWDRHIPSWRARVKHVFWREPSSTRGYLYWEHIRAHMNPAEFWKQISQLQEEELMEKVAEHLFVLSCVATEKYMSLTRSVGLALPGGALAAILLFFER
jgi:hypothetical protein